LVEITALKCKTNVVKESTLNILYLFEHHGRNVNKSGITGRNLAIYLHFFFALVTNSI
jgi:hypothetical protein